jgi:hypothetical protein
LVVYVCDEAMYSTMKEAWWGEHTSCLDTKAIGTISRRERAAVRAAYGGKVTLDKLEVLYGICGSNNSDWPYVDEFDDTLGSPAAVREFAGAITLCPDHPNIDRAPRAISRSNAKNEAAKNRIDGDGRYRVGEEVTRGPMSPSPSVEAATGSAPMPTARSSTTTSRTAPACSSPFVPVTTR